MPALGTQFTGVCAVVGVCAAHLDTCAPGLLHAGCLLSIAGCGVIGGNACV